MSSPGVPLKVVINYTPGRPNSHDLSECHFCMSSLACSNLNMNETGKTLKDHLENIKILKLMMTSTISYISVALMVIAMLKGMILRFQTYHQRTNVSLPAYQFFYE